MIKERFNKLEIVDQRRLLYAFENGFSQIVICESTFVGVNVTKEIMESYEIEEVEGDWSTGRLRPENKI